MSLINDYKFISGNKKGLVFITLFRIGHFFAKSNIIIKIIGLPYRVFYLIFVQWILGIDVPDRTDIGVGFNVWHGQGLVVHPECIIGKFVTIRHNTTIGQKNEGDKPPIIGNHVDIGAHCVIIGNIKIGDYCIIGAGSIVTKNVPERSLVYGNPLIIKPIV